MEYYDKINTVKAVQTKGDFYESFRCCQKYYQTA